ncbi:MAG TPA: HAD hydrolase-like protein [Dyella sp.]|uniref:HAD family hydrolase n=1 Tax=Dyella sp. TaxID=1869338 RepID=UPI002D78B337|nr:HAD hydrolase-like protein [Dyella sp.]HET6554195.1 HAD hydrolase-like protein [Dyella sp.]
MHQERVAIFDLDRALFDAEPDITEAVNEVMHIHGLSHITRSEALCMMGDGLCVFAIRAFQLRGMAAGEDEIAMFKARYGRRPTAQSKLYPGVLQALRTLVLEGWRMIVRTNQTEELALKILRRLGIFHFFDAVYGEGAKEHRTSDPSHLEDAIARASLRSSGFSVMIGAHPADVLAARLRGRWPAEVATRSGHY